MRAGVEPGIGRHAQGASLSSFSFSYELRAAADMRSQALLGSTIGLPHHEGESTREAAPGVPPRLSLPREGQLEKLPPAHNGGQHQRDRLQHLGHNDYSLFAFARVRVATAALKAPPTLTSGRTTITTNANLPVYMIGAARSKIPSCNNARYGLTKPPPIRQVHPEKSKPLMNTSIRTHPINTGAQITPPTRLDRTRPKNPRSKISGFRV